MAVERDHYLSQERTVAKGKTSAVVCRI